MKILPRALRAKLERFRAHYREGGGRRILKMLAYYGSTTGFGAWLADMRILCLSGAAALQPLEPLAGYTFRFAGEADLPAILACVSTVERAYFDRLFHNFLRDGRRCVIALFEARVVGYLWAFTGEYVITLDDYRRRNVTVRLPANAAFIGNAFIASPHRSRGLYQRLTQYFMKQDPTFTNFYVLVSDLNTSSLAASHKLGFRELMTLRFVGLFSHTQLYIRETDVRRWRRFPAPWPSLKLDGMQWQWVSTNQP
jgi:hypothetical protein